jgi:hypothetical protein
MHIVPESAAGQGVKDSQARCAIAFTISPLGDDGDGC